MRKPIRRDIQRNSHALVVHELGQKIVAGTYSVGTLLPGDGELAEKFQVSRTVLREAMKTLSAKGLIAPRAGIGTRVTEESSWNLFDADVLTWYFQRGITEEFMNHLTEMRQAIEPAAARLAAKNATRKDILELYSLVEDMNEATTAHELAVMDLEFHLKLLSASKNPVHEFGWQSHRGRAGRCLPAEFSAKGRGSHDRSGFIAQTYCRYD